MLKCKFCLLLVNFTVLITHLHSYGILLVQSVPMEVTVQHLLKNACPKTLFFKHYIQCKDFVKPCDIVIELKWVGSEAVPKAPLPGAEIR